MRAERIPISYSRHMGRAIRLWLKMSGVGVRMAAMTKITRTAYFRLRARNWGVTMPRRAAMVMASGSSKMTPKARRNFRVKSTYSLNRGICWIVGSKVSRNCRARGRTMMKQKVAPRKKQIVDRITKGMAKRRSFGSSPGSTNFQIWYRTTGSATNSPRMKATLKWVQRVSAGPRAGGLAMSGFGGAGGAGGGELGKGGLGAEGDEGNPPPHAHIGREGPLQEREEGRSRWSPYH